VLTVYLEEVTINYLAYFSAITRSPLSVHSMATFTFPSEPPERSLPSDPVSRGDIEHVRKHGYVVLESVFSKAEAEEAKAEIKRMSGSAPMVGRNAFEGLDTNRIYSLLNK